MPVLNHRQQSKSTNGEKSKTIMHLFNDIGFLQDQDTDPYFPSSSAFKTLSSDSLAGSITPPTVTESNLALL